MPLKMIQFDGTPEETVTLTSSDVAQALSASILSNAGRTCKGMLITVETNPVRIALGGATPTQGSTPDLGHVLDVGSTARFYGEMMAAGFKYISANSGNAGYIQLTPLY